PGAVLESPGAIVVKKKQPAWSCDHEIEPAVVVVVHELGRTFAAPQSLPDCERAIAGVAPQPGRIGGQEHEVQRAVVVVVAGGDRDGTAAPREAAHRAAVA